MNAVDPVVARIRKVRGFQTILADKLGITPAAVGQWPRVPAKHVYRVARILDLHPHTIRPDIFPPPRKSKRSLEKA